MGPVAARRILVVDDDPKILGILEKMLGEADFEVRGTSDSSEALRLAGEVRPQIAILDIAMPPPDGFEVAARIRSDAVLADMALVFLSAQDATANLRKAQELRAAAYVEKPFQKEALLGLLEQILARSK